MVLILNLAASYTGSSETKTPFGKNHPEGFHGGFKPQIFLLYHDFKQQIF